MLGIGQFCKSTVLTLGKVFVYRAGEGLGRDQRCWAAWVRTKDAPDQKGPGFYSADHVLSKSCLLGSEAAPDGRPLSSRSRPGTGVTAPLLVARVSEPPGSLYLLPPWPLKPPLLPAPPSFQTPSHGGLRTVFVSRSGTRLIKCIPACLIFLIVFI